MPVESAADLAGMFDTSDHADAVDYGRGGAWTSISAILSTPSDLVGTRGRALAREALVQASDIPGGAAQRGDNIRIGAQIYKIEQADPDTIGATVTLILAPVAGTGGFIAGVSDVGGTGTIA